MICYKNHCEILQFKSFTKYTNIIHFSTTRSGGFSRDAFSSFNLSEYSGDSESDVTKNRNKLCEILQLNPVNLFVPFQIHGTEIAVIDKDFLTNTSQKEKLSGRDALITNLPNVCIGVTTADCVPVLLYSEDQKVVSAVHAGWRGTQQKILQKTVEQMIDNFGCNPEKIHAAIGPSISPASFEVGEEVYCAFKDAGFNMKAISFRHPDTKKHHIDLWKANEQQLSDMRIPGNQIENPGICTLKNNYQFFSARRLGIQSGRMLTGICLK